MKKTILSIAVIAAAFVAASCQKENLQENNASEGSASVFTATIESGASTKTTVERVDWTEVIYKTKWDNGDEIGINNGTTFTATPASDATKATFTKKNAGDTDPTATFKAYFPIELFKQIKGPLGFMSLPETYDYEDGKYNMPMYAESTTTSLSFKNLCGVLAITVKGTDFTSVNSIEVSSDKQMNGAFTAAADGTFTFDTEGVTLTDAHKKVALNFEPAKSIESAGSATFYIPVPPATNHTLTIKVTDGSTTKIMVTKKSGGVAVERKIVYPIDFEDNSDALLGVFTVANDGAGNVKKVRFSPGNLYYDGSAFKFEDKQYSNTTEWKTSHVSNFYWSKTASSAYATAYDNAGSTGDVLFTNETVTTPNTNFTVSGMKGLWRTLSRSEWKYLLEERTMTNGKKRYSNAMKDGVTIDAGTYKGIFLYPDNYNGDIVSDLMTWEQINAAGIVFLPSTGYRDGISITEVSDTKISCIYWTSTADSYDEAYRMFFKWDDSEPEGSKLVTDLENAGWREWAVGIRLVSDVK